MAKKRGTGKGGLVYSTDPNFVPYQEEEESKEMPFGEQAIRITLDRKHRGGKTVTLISGFEMPDDPLSGLSKELKSFCGTGGSSKDHEILLQGDHRDKALKWLQKKGFKKTGMK